MSEGVLETTKSSSNGRQIPEAIFLDDVQSWVGGAGVDPEVGLTKLQQTLGRATLEQKIPELERTIGMIDQLGSEQGTPELTTTFELCDTLYATAKIKQSNEVYIWLGANTMLSYPLDQAHSLLANKLSAATTSLVNVKEDLAWLRDQITVTEVNIARLYNYDVKRRRDLRQNSNDDN